MVHTTYVAEAPDGAYAETLANLRPSLAQLASIGAVPSDPADTLPPPAISSSWRDARVLAEGVLHAPAASEMDITLPGTIAALRATPELAQCALKNGFMDVDEATLKSSSPAGRFFSQFLAGFLFDRGVRAIRYGSRHYAAYSCLAVFSTDQDPGPPITAVADHDIRSTDPALVQVARAFGLTIYCPTVDLQLSKSVRADCRQL